MEWMAAARLPPAISAAAAERVLYGPKNCHTSFAGSFLGRRMRSFRDQTAFFIRDAVETISEESSSHVVFLCTTSIESATFSSIRQH